MKDTNKEVKSFLEHNIRPRIFFSPSHTFDEVTLKAIKDKTSIRVISDTIAWDIYKDRDFWFVPQQSGRVRKLPFRTVTFCYHPNMMNEKSFYKLEQFIASNRELFCTFNNLQLTNRGINAFDKVLKWLYFVRR